MASPEVLGSSPARAVRKASPQNAPSSSPGLPSLQEIFSRNKNEAAPSDITAATRSNETGSATQSRPLQARDTRLIVLEEQTETSKHDGNNLSARSTSTADGTGDLESGILVIDAPEKTFEHSSSTGADKPWKKFKSESTSPEAPKPPRASDASPRLPPPIVIDSETSSPSGQKVESPASPTPGGNRDRGRDKSFAPLQLEPAMTRKLNWTPPANKTRVELKSSPGSSAQPSSSSPGILQKASVFQTLSDTYGCKEKEQPLVDLPKMNFKVVRKRKLIELVPIKPGENGEAAEVSEKPIPKAKAPKKKKKQQQTITALATAAYRVPLQPEATAPSASLRDYFPTDGKEAAPKEQETAGKMKKPRKKTTKVSKKKAPPPKPVLLSPRTAMKQVSNQDFVFGTSSQLAREQSPSLLRDLHAAMRASNHDLADAEGFDTPINSDAIEGPDQRSKLWDAGARDAEGDLVDLEVIDLVGNSPQLPPLVDYGDPFGYRKNDGEGDVGPTAAKVSPMEANDDSFVNLSDILPSPKPRLGETAKTCDAASTLDVSSDDDFELHATAIVPKAGGDDTSKIEEALSTAPQDSVQPQRPKFELYTDAQLSKEIRSYGFKPVKRRTAMIALLDQCWESKARLNQNTNQVRMNSTAATPSVSVSGGSFLSANGRITDEPQRELTGLSEMVEQEPPPSAQPPPVSPKRPRGRPRKDPSTPTKATRAKTTTKKTTATKRSAPAAKAATVPPKKPATPRRREKTPSAIIEIPDSASEGASDLSITPYSSPEPTFSSPLPVDFSVSMDEDADPRLAPGSSDDQEALFNHVTRAVTSAPRTTDPSKPSWHEKILMYDPIVLEDLAAWLNSGQLTRVGFDGEISPGEVKQWCESKSICCLWKVNLRGKERKRL